MVCKICGAKQKEWFSTKVLQKYEVRYYFCEDCGFLCTEEPYWLAEAYSSAIADTDVGLLSRNNINCRILSNIIYYLLPKRGRDQIFVDVAGGMGVLTRLMRDVGFHFYWSDKYAENIFAKSFEYAGDVFYKEKKEIFALTAFSFLEHLVDPKAFIKEAIQKHSTKTIIFTMDIFNGVPPSTDWWYYSFKTGQHISFFQEKTLKEMAKNLNLYLYWSKDFYIMSEYVLSNTILKFCTGLLSHFLFLRAKKGTKSLLPNDYDYLLRLGEDDGA